MLVELLEDEPDPFDDSDEPDELEVSLFALDESPDESPLDVAVSFVEPLREELVVAESFRLSVR